MDLIADTCFIVALERERKHGEGPAHAFLAAHPQDRFHITFTVSGELACGQSAAAVQAWKTLCAPFPVLPWTMDVSQEYGKLYRSLKVQGKLIGTNDLWIAATAQVYGHPLLTANNTEFSRIPDLEVLNF